MKPHRSSLAWSACLLAGIVQCLPVQADTLTQTWAVVPGDRVYVTGVGSNLERGLAYNPVTRKVLLLRFEDLDVVHAVVATTEIAPPTASRRLLMKNIMLAN